MLLIDAVKTKTNFLLAINLNNLVYHLFVTKGINFKNSMCKSEKFIHRVRGFFLIKKLNLKKLVIQKFNCQMLSWVK